MALAAANTGLFWRCPRCGAQAPHDQLSPSASVRGRSAPANDDWTALDQTSRSNDRDQTSSDRDQTASDQDQTSSDEDEEASVDDQELLDRELFEGVDRAAHERHKRARLRTSATRLQTAESRDHTASDRWQIANERDRLADERDGLSVADGESADKGAAAGSLVEVGRVRANRYAWIKGSRRKAAEDRARAANDRGQAALDRAEAGRLRDAAAYDRSEAVRERALAGIDQLTGVSLRSIGLDAVERDIQRARRTGTTLALAFVDVNNLKRVNDTAGHLAGDMLLRSVAGTLQLKLRPYDTIMRFGGDEFICALADIEPEAVRRRFETIIGTLEASGIANPISYGFVGLEPADDLESLIKRADDALIETRRSTGHRPVRT